MGIWSRSGGFGNDAGSGSPGAAGT
jgi:hypothetical protein